MYSHTHSTGFISAGFDGRENVGEREALIAQARRPLAALPPHPADAAFLSDADSSWKNRRRRLFLYVR